MVDEQSCPTGVERAAVFTVQMRTLTLGPEPPGKPGGPAEPVGP